jgi:hypothetical protein
MSEICQKHPSLDNQKKCEVFDRLGNSVSLFVMNSSPNLFSIPTTVKINESNIGQLPTIGFG